MSNGTVFPVLSIDRNVTKWEDSLETLTPFENRDGRWYKREDYYAPLGYGGINGSKLRQLVFLFNQQQHASGVLTAASVLSPQISMGALVAYHYGLPIHVILGATNPVSSKRHENVHIANQVGATFSYIPVAYNPALQRAVKNSLAEPEFAGFYQLCYGITTPDNAGDAEIEAFHAVGARQVANLPATVKHLIMTAGSCNSCVSVLYGLAKYRPRALQTVTLMGIGPTKIKFIEQRLAAIERHTGLQIRPVFRRRYIHDPDLTNELQQPEGQYLLQHYDLHKTKFAGYQDRMPYQLDGINFHPTYEGKALRYMDKNAPAFRHFWDAKGDTAFWIVGSAPTAQAMAGLLPTAIP